MGSHHHVLCISTSIKTSAKSNEYRLEYNRNAPKFTMLDLATFDEYKPTKNILQDGLNYNYFSWQSICPSHFHFYDSYQIKHGAKMPSMWIFRGDVTKTK